MFIDEIEITLKAGNGGDGKVSFFPGKKSGPDGGDGGNGGNLYIRASKDVSNLNTLSGKQVISAENGIYGGSNNRTGANGQDLILNLPSGTLLTDQNTNEQIELTSEDNPILVCRGGQGGRGNAFFKSASNTTPVVAEKGKPGQKRYFKIIVKIFADFGLIGFPNTGKSSLLNILTRAKAKVANYPFTTLQPNLGVSAGKTIADIPGLIEGASRGKGLGIGFIKHIEKVRLLLHCICAESNDVTFDYNTIMKELHEFNPEIIRKKQIILLTKSDLLKPEEIKNKIIKLRKLQETVLPISIYDSKSIKTLINHLR